MSEKKVGRPAKPDAEKRQQIGVRTSTELKTRLEAEAASRGRSVAQEAEYRLQEAFHLSDLLSGDERTKAEIIQFAQLIRRAESATRRSWLDDIATHEAVRLLIEAAIKRSAPVPDGFSDWMPVRSELYELREEVRALKVVLLQCKAVTTTFAAMLEPTRPLEERFVIETAPETWREPATGRKLNENERDIIASKILELRSLERLQSSLEKRFDEMTDSVREARESGITLSEIINRGL